MHEETHPQIKYNNSNNKSEDTNAQVQKCKFCSVKFNSVNEYVFHLESAHQNNRNTSFMCSICGKQYKTKNELTQHINSKCGTIKQFKCKVCGQELMSAGSLYNHMLRHNGERSFMCRFCAKLFFTAGQLKVHERIHTKDKAYVCEVCNKGFCHRQSLITHSTLHTGIKPFQCENCGNSFSCVGNLIKHRKTHADSCGLIPLTTHRVQHPSTKIKVKINTPANSRLKLREKDTEVQKELENVKTEINKCEFGDKNNAVVVQENSVKEEKSEKHDLSIKTDCNKTKEIIHKKIDSSSESEDGYATDDAEQPEKLNNELIHFKDSTYQKHKYIKKKYPKDPKYEDSFTKFLENKNFDFVKGYAKCKYCGKKYTNSRWYFKHIQNHENSIPEGVGDKPDAPLHKCSCCKLTFYTKEENSIHQQTVHGDILTCQECEKIFANRDSLRSHQKIFHKGFTRKAYIYICDKCGQQFKQKSYLKTHEERNCDKGPFYECSICQKQFASVYTRNNHMRVHNPEKKLLCKFCAKSFHWKGQLKIHERSHTGEKPFACLYCPKAFAYRESLITHSSIHTGIKPHLCEGCGSRFSCIGNLIKHRTNHASECGVWDYRSQKQPSAVRY